MPEKFLPIARCWAQFGVATIPNRLSICASSSDSCEKRSKLILRHLDTFLPNRGSAIGLIPAIELAQTSGISDQVRSVSELALSNASSILRSGGALQPNVAARRLRWV